MKAWYKPFLWVVFGLAIYPVATATYHEVRKVKIGTGDQSGWLYQIASDDNVKGQLFVYWDSKTPGDTIYIAACLRGNNLVCEMANADGQTNLAVGANGTFACSDGSKRPFRLNIVAGLPLNPFVIGNLQVKPGIAQDEITVLSQHRTQKFQGSLAASPCLVADELAEALPKVQSPDPRRTQYAHS